MSRGRRSKTFDKEYTREKELSYKNKKLQRELARLKREISKLRSGGWVIPEKVEKLPEKPKKDRTCYSCGKGSLVIIKYGKPNNEDWYYRSCNLCGYRTRSKKFTEEVEE